MDRLGLAFNTSLLLASTEPLSIAYEDYVRAKIAHCYITNGHSLRTGSHAGHDRVISGWPLVWHKESRNTSMYSAGDLHIEGPQLALEIKCFCEFTSKDFPDKSGIIKDLNHLADGNASALLIVSSDSAYKSLLAPSKKYNVSGGLPAASLIHLGEPGFFSDLQWNSVELFAVAQSVDLILNGKQFRRSVVIVCPCWNDD